MADAFGPVSERERILSPATAPADPHGHWLTPGMPCLGLDQLSDPISYFRGAVLPVHRTVLGWIKAGFHGIVPADIELLWGVLNELPELNDGDDYHLGAEDLDHAEELEADLSPLPDHIRILVPFVGMLNAVRDNRTGSAKVRRETVSEGPANAGFPACTDVLRRIG